MKQSLFILLCFCLLLCFSNNINALGSSDPEKEGFDMNELIMHHIKDAHEWHIIDYTNKNGEKVNVSIPLPIIVYYNGQLDIFSSRNFEHGNKIVEKGKHSYMLYHEKIYIANGDGGITYEEKDGEHKILNEKPLDFSITKNVASMMLVSVILLIVFISVARAYKKNPGRPKGLQAFMEPLILFVRDDIVYPSLGKKNTDKFLPFLLTIFFFILFNNLMGVIPFFPGNANVTGNIAVTMTLALFTFIMININGNKNYWKHTFWMPGVPVFVKPILAVVELIGLIVKPVALTIRLFANITAGHIIIISLVGLIFVFKSLAISPVSVIFVLFMDCLELLVACLQAYIFTMLSSLFIATAVQEHHH